MIRLFVGLELPEDIKKKLLTLRGGVPGAVWRPMDKMHLTLRFIGEINEQMVHEVIRELRSVRFPAFHLSLSQIGYFAVGARPHHLWVGVQDHKALIELHQKIVDAFKHIELPVTDKYKFMPHVTLAKLQGTTLDDVFTYISQNNLFKTEPFLVDSFALFSSRVRENGEGKFHTPEEFFPLSLV